MAEDQAGVPVSLKGRTSNTSITTNTLTFQLYLDVQLLDTSTCDPVPAVYIDAWHCNATGVYSGVTASGNGNSDDTVSLRTK